MPPPSVLLPLMFPRADRLHILKFTADAISLDLPDLRFVSIQEIVIISGGEVIFSTGLAAERFAVTDFLQVVQAAGDAFIAVAVKGVEVDGSNDHRRRSRLQTVRGYVGSQHQRYRVL